MSRLKQDTEFADLTVTCGGNVWRVHSAILAIRSPFFKAAITSSMAEKLQMNIDIKDFEPEAMEEVINFMYGVPKEKTSVKFLFEAAERFQMDDLKEYAVELASKVMTSTNVVELAHLAETYSVEGFMGECAEFIVKNDVPLKEEDMSSKLAVMVVAILKDENQKLKEKCDGDLTSSEEAEWSLHNINLNGQLLEYERGGEYYNKGSAQAKKPLSTRNYYFEIELLDPRTSGFITIGLTEKNYTESEMPGFYEGSIGYFADDGYVFMGSIAHRAGEFDGPVCSKGDIMGCGVLFPRDYECKSDSEEEQGSETDAGEDEDELKGKTYFTRNGMLIGMKEVALPKGGFFPTVGIVSFQAKVRVNLKPDWNPVSIE